MTIRRLLCLSLGATALAGGVPAFAQTTAPAAPAAAAPETSDAGIQDIVVTAQRRDQKQQDVPISITAVSAATADRAGARTTEQLSQLVPSLQFSRNTGNGGTPYIRGIGTSVVTPGGSPPVATYVDDVYIAAAAATVATLGNIDRIEVLKGPQGTLFGRNATGGVISIHTRQPTIDPALDLTVGYGNFHTFDSYLYASGGLSDTLAVNFAGSYHNQADGYGRDINTGDDVYKSKDYSARTEALWRPGDTTKVWLSADYSRSRNDLGLNPTILPGTISLGGQTPPGNYRATQVPADTDLNRQYGVSGRIDQQLSFARLVSITAFRNSLNDFSLDLDGSVPSILNLIVSTRTRNVSQEVQLQSLSGSKLQWILGGYYYHERAGFLPVLNTGASQAAFGGETILNGIQTLNSYAGFAEANYEIFPGTRLTGGIRYTTDHYDVDYHKTNAAGVALPGTPVITSTSFSKVTYRAVLDHHFSQDTMAYASVSRGFKSGGYNINNMVITVAGVPQPAPPVAPEVVDAYEVGLKTEFFDHKLRLNPSVFVYRYNNLQVSAIVNGIASLFNAASVHIWGVDLDFEAAPVRRLHISGGVSYLHSRFSSFPGGTINVPNPANCATRTTTGPLTGGNTTCTADLSGYTTPRSPTFTGTINVAYTAPTDIGDVTLSGSFYHNSGFDWDADDRVKQPTYNLVSANLGWASLDKKFDVSLWVHNLTNAYYFLYAGGSTTRDSGSPAAPRTFGITAGFHFGKGH